MTTKKVEAANREPSKLERGRFSRLLGNGYVIEVEPAKKPGSIPKSAGPKPVPPKN
jgi:hypothetical protein